MEAEPADRFAALVGGHDEVPLAEACMVICAQAHPALDVTRELARLDELAAAVEEPTVEALVHRLFVVEGFSGDTTSYHDARNSHLVDVLDRRLGIPITLAVVAIEVGRRCGVPLVGVGMPGHFLVRHDTEPSRLLDVFDRGAPLDPAGAQEIFTALHPSARWDDSFLAPVTDRTILVRILANLANAHRRAGNRVGLCWALTLRSHLPDFSERERRELALVLGASGRFVEAAEALEDLGGEKDAEAALRLRARLN